MARAPAAMLTAFNIGGAVNRRQFDVAVPMLYAIAVVATALLTDGALVPVTVIGAMLVGLYFTVRGRGNMPDGRNRNRNRNR